MGRATTPACLPPYMLSESLALNTSLKFRIILKEEILMELPRENAAAAAAAKSLQLCPTLCDSIDGSPPSSSVPGVSSPHFCRVTDLRTVV